MGWVFQFIGHGFEGKPPKCLSDWRFLFVGLRWWQHVRGPVAFEGERIGRSGKGGVMLLVLPQCRL
ncbi:hypothetical protein H6F86_10695 [Phormidium sp. FACHB-592]|uniref:Uncharacterized protein n=1 Tax=Stenomitos frigidus AS-A4 TaxID=2933935 RepID=A0ABV0KRH8_9CYAN|nr:hypothetical protein [Phormidium sp. FACHB-592]